jgi:hypothetical protein
MRVIQIIDKTVLFVFQAMNHVIRLMASPKRQSASCKMPFLLLKTLSRVPIFKF